MERLSNCRSKRNKLRALWKSRELEFLFLLAAHRQFYGAYSIHDPSADVPLNSRTTPLILVSLPEPSAMSYGIYVDDKNELRLGIVTVVPGYVVGLQVAADDPKGRESVLLALTEQLVENMACERQFAVESYVAKCSERIERLGWRAQKNIGTLKQMLSLSKATVEAVARKSIAS